jgi:large repetitive protein
VSVTGGSSTPTGTVSVTGADVNCTITLSGGMGSCVGIVFNTAGPTKLITATYNGDATHFSSSGTRSQAVGQTTSVTTITTTSPNPSATGQSVAVTVTVTGAGVAPTGTVNITGADTNCSITLASGTGSCNVIFATAAGSPKTLTATYVGDTNYLTSTGTATQTVNPGPVSMIVRFYTEPSVAGNSVTVGVQLYGAGVLPTGTVVISGADSAPCTITLSAGSGSCYPVTFTTAGVRTITFTYSGDANYTGLVVTRDHVVNP